MRAKVPVLDPAGQVVGVVSVGSLEARIGEQWRGALPRLLVLLLLALAVGAFGSWLLARRLKRQTFGLEPAEIGRLLEQREATLHGVREGLLVLDGGGRITLVNDEAVRLLHIPRRQRRPAGRPTSTSRRGCATSCPARPTARTRSCCGRAACWCSTASRSTSGAGASARW